MKAKSIKGETLEEITLALQNSLQDGFDPSLAIVFMSVKQDRKAVRELLHQRGVDVFGATSCGEFIDGFHSEGAMVMLLLDLPRQAYALLFEDIGERTIAAAAKSLAEQAAAKFIHPCLILCSTGMNTLGEFFDGTTMMETVKTTLGHEVIFFGGMAGDDMTFTGSYLFNREKETDFGLAAVVLDGDKVNMRGLAITGWQPMGISRLITKSSGNLVYTIDHKPAVDMYLHYLGKQENARSQNFDLMNDVSLHYPFIVERPGGGTFLHTPLRINPAENALELDVPMPEGTKFWFSMPPDFDIVDQILDEARRIKNHAPAEALLVYSCAGRFPVLGPLVHAENEGLHDIWEAPMAGFFTYGEYGRDELDKQEFHSGACCWVTLTEK